VPTQARVVNHRARVAAGLSIALGALASIVGPLASPALAAPVSGDVFVADTSGGRVVFLPAGGGAASDYQNGLFFPRQVFLDDAGDLLIADQGNNRVVRVPADGSAATEVITNVDQASGVVEDSVGNIYVASYGTPTVTKIAAAGGPPTTIPMIGPFNYEMAVDAADNVYVPQVDSDTVQVIPADGGPLTTFVSGFANPTSIAIDGDGLIYISSYTDGSIKRFEPDGTPLGDFLTGLAAPAGIDFDDQGNLYIAQASGSVVMMPAAGGDLVTVPSAPDGAWGVVAFGSPLSGEIAQSITFTSAAPTDAQVGDTYEVSATGGDSGNPVTFTIDAASADVCTVVDDGDSTGTVSFTGAGDCMILADQAGDATYAAAPQAQQVVAVSKVDQTITFTSDVPVDARVGEDYEVSATGGGSGNPVTFTIDAASADVCTVVDDGDSTGTVSFTGAGDCTILADQAGNDMYAAAPQAQQGVTVAKVDQSITFSSTPPADASVGEDYEVAATGGDSGNPVTFTIAGLSSGVCSVVDNGDSTGTVSFTGEGTCSILADQAGDDTYAAAPQATQNVAVERVAQTITFTSTVPAEAQVRDRYTVSATGGDSGNPVTFTAAEGSDDVCTVVDRGDNTATVFLTAPGTCVVQADQAGNATYADASPVQQSVVVARIPQEISFTSDAPTDARVADTYTVSAVGGDSGNEVALSADAGSAGICTVADNGDSTALVTMAGTGLCVINANQAGSADFAAAAQAQQSFSVAKIDQQVMFTSTPPARARVGGSYQPSASGGDSGNPVQFSVSSVNGACTISSLGVVEFVHARPCTITANQAGNANYEAAAPVSQVVRIRRAPQRITVKSSPPDNARVGGVYRVRAEPGASGKRVRYSVKSANGACAVTADGVVSLLRVGRCVVILVQRGSKDYLPAPIVRQRFAIGAR
jgi:hypothetical protein